MPSFGEWGFILATRVDLDPAAGQPTVPLRFLNPGSLAAMFVFPLDMARPEEPAINEGDRPVLAQLYRRGWAQFNNR